MLPVFFSLLLFGIVVTGIVRWGYKFAEQIKAGVGWGWLQPAFTLLAAVCIGIAYAIVRDEAPVFGLLYAAGTLALIQYGYELIVKPLLGLADFLVALFASLAAKFTPPSAAVTSDGSSSTTTDSAAVIADKTALASAKASLATAQAALKAAKATYAATATADNATAVATAQAAVDSAEATVTAAQGQLAKDQAS